MRRVVLIPILIFGILGCAQLKHARDNASACLADPVCVQEATAQRNKGTSMGELFGGLAPVPWAGKVAGSILGGVFLIAYLVRDKKKVTP